MVTHFPGRNVPHILPCRQQSRTVCRYGDELVATVFRSRPLQRAGHSRMSQ